MAQVIRGFIGKEDFKLYDGTTNSFSRNTVTGGTESLSRINWGGVDILHVYGNGTDYTDVTIRNAVAAVGSTNQVKFWLSSGTWLISSNLTLSSNVTLHLEPGAILTDDTNNANLTINGEILAHDDQQIFNWGNGTGSISLSSSVVFLFWFQTTDNLSIAVDAIASNNTELHINNNATLTSDVTIPSNINLNFRIGNILTINAGVTLTLPFNNINCQPAQQIFSNSGTVTASDDGSIYVDQFGTDYVAFNDAIAATEDIKLVPGATYTLTAALDQITQNGTRITAKSYKQITRIIYTPTSGTIISINADSCEISGMWITGPGTAGTDRAIKLESSTWRNTIRDIRIRNAYVAIENAGYDNTIDNFYIENVGLAGYYNTDGSSGSVNHGYLANDTKTTAVAIRLDSGTHINIEDVKIGNNFNGGILIGAIRSVNLIDVHIEQTEAAPNNASSDIAINSTLPTVNIIGGRYGSDQLSSTTFALSLSGGASNRLNIIGAFFAGNDANGGGNGHFEDNEGSFIFLSGIYGNQVTSGDFTVGDGQVFIADKSNLDIDGNFQPDGYLRATKIFCNGLSSGKYNMRKTTVVNNAVTDYFSIDCSNETFAGIIKVVANRNGESSSHVYQIHSDPLGPAVTEIGTGKDRNATVALSATLSSGVVEIAADTTSNDWAGDNIAITITADITSSGGTITFADL